MINCGYDFYFRLTLTITGILLLIIGTAIIGPMPDGEYVSVNLLLLRLTSTPQTEANVGK